MMALLGDIYWMLFMDKNYSESILLTVPRYVLFLTMSHHKWENQDSEGLSAIVSVLHVPLRPIY
jgi:hypothetical protein